MKIARELKGRSRRRRTERILLEGARRHLAASEWLKGKMGTRFYRDRDRVERHAHCAAGALECEAIRADMLTSPVHESAYVRLSDAVPKKRIPGTRLWHRDYLVNWNDAPPTTKRDVLKAFDRAVNS